MSVRRYTAEPWTTVKIRKKLYETIFNEVRRTKIKGIRKYNSVPDFIQDACLRLLERDGEKVAEVVAN